MNHLCWWNENAGAIQAICAIAGVIGLIIYCALTARIRTATVAQQKAAQAPMLMFVEAKRQGEVLTHWVIKNYGVGPAVGIWWKPGSSNHSTNDWYEIGALGAGDESDLPHSRSDVAFLREMPSDGARLHYSDSAGNHYATWGLWKDECFTQDWISLKHKERVELRRVPHS